MLNTIKRSINVLKRPSKKANQRRMVKNGETIDSLVIRDATAADVPALAALHTKAWSETYWTVKNPPTYEIREQQWREQFEVKDDSWFCLVVENSKKQLVGFAKGVPYMHATLADYSGELNKIYLLANYQRLGLGRKLICQTARRFLSKGITSMLLFGDATNPSNSFYEAMGGERLYAKNGDFQGGYGWKDLTKLTAICDI